MAGVQDWYHRDYIATMGGIGAKVTEQGLVLAKEQHSSGNGAIAAFSSQGNFEAAQRMAKALASSDLVPEAYRGKLPNCLIAMELASRIGVSVFAAMQNLDIIHGRPSWRSQFLIATVNGSGRFSPLRYQFFGTPNTDTWGCRCVAKDRESGEECIGPDITVALAKAEGWYQKNGSKWKTLTQLMLSYRAAAFWTRLYAPELSLGMSTVEEADDIYAHSAPTVELPASVITKDVKSLEESLAQATAQDQDAPEEDVQLVDQPRMREPNED